MLALLLVLGLTASAQPPAPSGVYSGTAAESPELERDAAALQAERDRVEALVRRLVALQDRYQEAGAISRLTPWRDIGRISAERAPLCAEIHDRFLRFNSAFDLYRGRRDALRMARAAKTFREVAKGAAVGQETLAVLGLVRGPDDILNDARAWERRNRHAVEAEEAAFALVSEAASKQQALLAGVAMLLFLVALTAWLWARASRKRRQLETEVRRLSDALGPFS